VFSSTFPARLIRAFLVLLVCYGAVLADDPVDSLDRSLPLRAAFLNHFRSFVNWPAPFGSRKTTQYCFLEKRSELAEEFRDSIYKLYGNKSNVKILKVSSVAELTSCHIAYFGEYLPGDSLKELSSLSNLPVLTVGSGEDFLQNGGILRFFEEGNRLRFEIHLEQAKKQDLRISPDLLKLARIYSP